MLIINPGSTSTKIAVYEDTREVFSANTVHTDDSLNACAELIDQLPLRIAAVREALRENGIEESSLSGVVGRGGLIPGLKNGAYLVNENMCALIRSGKLIPHASNLGALLARQMAEPIGVPAVIYDAVSSDDMWELARITGFPNVRRVSYCHTLNSRAMGRKYAQSLGKKYEEMDLLVAHLGGGISISAHHKGRIVDVISDDAGPFSPERAGSIPLLEIIDMCYSGLYTKAQVIKMQRGQGGLKGWLGTADCREIERRIETGDTLAAQIYEAQAYQIAKGIGNLAPALNCAPEAILLTGGLAYSKRLTDMVIARVKAMAPVVILPGEHEMEALALGLLRVLNGEETAKEY